MNSKLFKLKVLIGHIKKVEKEKAKVKDKLLKFSNFLPAPYFLQNCRLSKILGDLACFAYFCCMVEITNKLVDDLAHLSRLTFNEEEKEAIKSDLKEMISFVEKLNEVDTSNVEPLLHITPHQNILRDDVIEGSITREEALKNVPNTDGEYILVPKVIKK